MLILTQPQKLKHRFGLLKEMFFENEHILNEVGDTLIFAGSEKDEDNNMHVFMDFSSPYHPKAFAGENELKVKTTAAEPVLESTAVTVLSSKSFTSTTWY